MCIDFSSNKVFQHYFFNSEDVVAFVLVPGSRGGWEERRTGGRNNMCMLVLLLDKHG